MSALDIPNVPDSLKVESKLFITNLIDSMSSSEYTSLNDPLLSIPNEFKRVELEKTFDFPQFYDLVMSSWEEYLENNREIFGQTRITHAYPRLNINNDENIKIVLRLGRRAVGTFSQQKGSANKMFGDVRTRKPVLRTKLEDSRYPGYSIYLLEQYFDNVVVFNIVANSSNDAENWALFFEDFLLSNSYKWSKYLRFFRYDGMMSGEEFFGPAQYSQTGHQQSQYYYSLRCEVGTVKTTRILEKDLERFYINIKLSENDKSSDQPNRSIT